MKKEKNEKIKTIQEWIKIGVAILTLLAIVWGSTELNQININLQNIETETLRVKKNITMESGVIFSNETCIVLEKENGTILAVC